MAQYGTQAVITSQPLPTVIAVDFGETPVQMQCPTCQNNVVSRLEYVSGACTWIWCFFCIGVFAFCCDCTKDVRHACPSCGRQLGFYRRC